MWGEDFKNLCYYKKWPQVSDYLNGFEKKENKKAVIEWKGVEYGLNSFSYACQYGAPVDIIQKMIDIAGDDIVFVTNYGETPLHMASLQGRKAIVELLINVGGKRLVMMQNDEGITALHRACFKDDNSEVVKLLVQFGGSELTSIRNNTRGKTASEVEGGSYKYLIRHTLKKVVLEKSTTENL